MKKAELIAHIESHKFVDYITAIDLVESRLMHDVRDNRKILTNPNISKYDVHIIEIDDTIHGVIERKLRVHIFNEGEASEKAFYARGYLPKKTLS